MTKEACRTGVGARAYSNGGGATLEESIWVCDRVSCLHSNSARLGSSRLGDILLGPCAKGADTGCTDASGGTGGGEERVFNQRSSEARQLAVAWLQAGQHSGLGGEAPTL